MTLIKQLRHEALNAPLLIKKDLFTRAAGRIEELEYLLARTVSYLTTSPVALPVWNDVCRALGHTDLLKNAQTWEEMHPREFADVERRAENGIESTPRIEEPSHTVPAPD